MGSWLSKLLHWGEEPVEPEKDPDEDERVELRRRLQELRHKQEGHLARSNSVTEALWKDYEQADEVLRRGQEARTNERVGTHR